MNTLRHLEAEVDSGIEAIQTMQERIWFRLGEVARALAEIRTRKLYSGTWDEYLRGRFGFGADRAAQIAKAAEGGTAISVQIGQLNEAARLRGQVADTIEHVREASLPEPRNERQMRALLQAPASVRLTVWRSAVKAAQDEGRRVTALDVRHAIQPAPPQAGNLSEGRLEWRIEDLWSRLPTARRKALLPRLAAKMED